MTRPKRIARNMGRVEFIACRETIDAMRRQGFDNKKIHAALAEKGRVTMAYATFCYHMTRFAKAEAEMEERQSRYASTAKPGEAGRHGFHIDKTPSHGEII